MKHFFFFLAILALATSATAQIQTNQYAYAYDANGNRIVREMATVYVTLKVAPPQTITTLPNGLTPEQVAAGATVAINEQVALAVYPNPTTQQITVAIQEGAVLVQEARLYGSNGSMYHTLKNPGGNFSMNLDGLAAGNYMLWLKLSDGNLKRVKVVKL